MPIHRWRGVITSEDIGWNVIPRERRCHGYVTHGAATWLTLRTPTLVLGELDTNELRAPLLLCLDLYVHAENFAITNRQSVKR